MEWMFMGMVIFLFLLAAFDLWVGVSNDAVNFLNSAIGSRTAHYRTLIIIASVGVFAGCALSDGMMDIARHGIFTPQYFSYRDVMYIYLAVMVTDIVLLDLFNTFGMPTSTTVSMVFELLGASFAFVLIKMATDGLPLGIGDYLNTSKALEVILGIFLSVPIAFFFGTVVQYITRIIFTFDLRHRIAGKVGLFGGFAVTAILYFMLFKGLNHLSFMTPEVKEYIDYHILLILGIVFLVATLLMQLLHFLHVNVFKVVVLCGTFALATAFAGNDLVNFLGVPLAGYSASIDFSTHALGQSPDQFLMDSLQSSAHTPIIFLLVAGTIMVISLATSKKARRVVETEVGLSRKDEGDEMFGSSRAARSLVRWSSALASGISRITPEPVSRFIDSRFHTSFVADTTEASAAYDQLRASVNLVMAALLIALGTSLKLPLSTTFVTFMVAMGTSLADRAWSRESAVFRITGVLTVIGGWFLTAGVAFTASFLVANLMHVGGVVAVVMFVAGGIYAIIHSQRQFNRKQRQAAQSEGDLLFRQMLQAEGISVMPLLTRHISMSIADQFNRFATDLQQSTDGLFHESLRPLRRSLRDLTKGKRDLKNLRRRETICLRRVQPPTTAVRVSTHFHLIHNSLRQMLYGLIRIAEPALDHVDNNFSPLPPLYTQQYQQLRDVLITQLTRLADQYRSQAPITYEAHIAQMQSIHAQIAQARINLSAATPNTTAHLSAMALMLHILQETEQFTLEVHHLLLAAKAYQELSNAQ